MAEREGFEPDAVLKTKANPLESICHFRRPHLAQYLAQFDAFPFLPSEPSSGFVLIVLRLLVSALTESVIFRFASATNRA